MMDTGHAAMQQLKAQIMRTVMDYPVNRQFTMRLCKPDTWIVRPFNPSPDTPHVHVLVGQEAALVIDPTDTPYNLRLFIEENITDKPLLVANTHSHRDHTYANWLFDDCPIYMSENCQRDLQKPPRPHGPDPVSEALGMDKVSKNPGTVLKPGNTIDLGDRLVEVVGIQNCHADSSLLYLDHGQGILFPGDEIDAGQINMWNIPVETFRQNMVYLQSRRAEFDMICCAHNGTPMHADVLKLFIENCDRIMAGIEGDLDVGSTSYLLNPFEPRSAEAVEYRRWDPVTRRSFWKGTAINYNVDLIWNSDLEKPHRMASPHPPRERQ